MGQLARLQEDLDAIQAAGLQVVEISYDSVDIIEAFVEKKGIEYLMLSDEGSKTIDAYGIRNTSGKPGTQTDGIPYPGTFIIDTEGIVRGKIFYDGYVKRHPNDELIALAKKVLN